MFDKQSQLSRKFDKIVPLADDYMFFIYDKFAVDHHYKNERTKNLEINDLKDGTYDVMYGQNAINFYNSRFFQFGNDVPNIEETNLYKFEVYKKMKDDIEYIIAISGIFVKKLEWLIKNKQEIPHKNFFRELCVFHTKYSSDINFFEKSEIKKLIKENMDFAREKCVIPVDYISDKKIQNKHITTKLFNYQQCSSNWIVKTELKNKTFYYNTNRTVSFKNIVYDVDTNKFIPNKSLNKVTFKGGAIIDEVGLGKSITMINGSLCNPLRDISYVKSGENRLRSRATLILCSNQLCKQWINEFKIHVDPEYKLKIISIMNKREYVKVTYRDILDADFVVCSFQYLANKYYTSKWTGSVNIKFSMNADWKTNGQLDNILEVFETISESNKNKIFEKLVETEPILETVKWHRIIIDEFHEIYTNAKYKFMNNTIKCLKSNYRWVLTGTPFARTDNLLPMFDFVTGHENVDDDKIFIIPEISEYISFSMFRKNTKDSVSKEHTLPKYGVEVKWLEFSQTERLMYDAFIANPNNDKFDVYLRQLCCHPKIIDQTKHLLNNCKTLDEIQAVMIDYYSDNEKIAETNVEKMKQKIKKQTNEIIMTKIERKRKLIISNANIFPGFRKFGSTDKIIAHVNSCSSDELDKYFGVLVKKQIAEETPKYILNMELSLQKKKSKLEKLEYNLEGARTTLTFYKIVVGKLNKIVKSENKEKNEDKYLAALDDDDFDINDLSVSSSEEDEDICPICSSCISDPGVTKCGHIFCYDCLKISISDSRKCPYCNIPITLKDVFKVSKESIIADESEENQTELSALINNFGTKIGNLISYLKMNTEPVIIFSQWDDLLSRIGRILKENDINNSFCRGNCYQREKTIKDFNNDNCDMNVIMLSSKNSASGINLTKASVIIFVDPIYGKREYRKKQEMQAIGRAYRLGQTKKLKVLRFIIKNSIEEEIHHLNLREDIQSEK